MKRKHGEFLLRQSHITCLMLGIRVPIIKTLVLTQDSVIIKICFTRRPIFGMYLIELCSPITGIWYFNTIVGIDN